MSEKKPRSDSKLDAMPESRVLELRDMMLAGKGQRECLDWLALECQVSVSPSALTSFYKRHCAPVIRERQRFASVKAEVLVEEAGRTDWNAATMEKVKQVCFEIMTGEKLDPKEAAEFVKLVLKADAQAIDKDKLTQASKTKIEAGLDALLAEINGNPKALAAFQVIKKEVQK
jgi:hypothetical protein